MNHTVDRLLTGPRAGGADDRVAWWDELAGSLATDAALWLDELGAGSSRDQAWVLLSWVEDAASRAVSQDRAELVARAAFALSLLEASPLDRRDVMVVALLLHRGCVVAGHDFLAQVRQGCAAAGELGTRCFAWLSRVRAETPATHEEVGAGGDFTFRRRDSAIDVDDLVRKFGRPAPGA